MSAVLLQTFQVPSWQSWLTPATGVLAAILFLLMARAFVRVRPTRSPTPHQAGTDSGGPFHERRKSPRRGGKPVQVLLSDREAKAWPEEAIVQNRSLGGLCLAVSRQYEAGAILTVRAESAPKSIPWAQIEVKYCYLRDESWLIGCKFVTRPAWNVQLTFD
jgi:hypothetical protein